MDKPITDNNLNTQKNPEKKLASNGQLAGSGHSLSTELNDLIFDLVDAIHQMGIPVKKTPSKFK